MSSHNASFRVSFSVPSAIATPQAPSNRTPGVRWQPRLACFLAPDAVRRGNRRAWQILNAHENKTVEFNVRTAVGSACLGFALVVQTVNNRLVECVDTAGFAYVPLSQLGDRKELNVNLRLHRNTASEPCNELENGGVTGAVTVQWSNASAFDTRAVVAQTDAEAQLIAEAIRVNIGTFCELYRNPATQLKCAEWNLMVNNTWGPTIPNLTSMHCPWYVTPDNVTLPAAVYNGCLRAPVTAECRITVDDWVHMLRVALHRQYARVDDVVEALKRVVDEPHEPATADTWLALQVMGVACVVWANACTYLPDWERKQNCEKLQIGENFKESLNYGAGDCEDLAHVTLQVVLALQTFSPDDFSAYRQKHTQTNEKSFVRCVQLFQACMRQYVPLSVMGVVGTPSFNEHHEIKCSSFHPSAHTFAMLVPKHNFQELLKAGRSTLHEFVPALNALGITNDLSLRTDWPVLTLEGTGYASPISLPLQKWPENIKSFKGMTADEMRATNSDLFTLLVNAVPGTSLKKKLENNSGVKLMSGTPATNFYQYVIALTPSGATTSDALRELLVIKKEKSPPRATYGFPYNRFVELVQSPDTSTSLMVEVMSSWSPATRAAIDRVAQRAAPPGKFERLSTVVDVGDGKAALQSTSLRDISKLKCEMVFDVSTYSQTEINTVKATWELLSTQRNFKFDARVWDLGRPLLAKGSKRLLVLRAVVAQ